LSAIFKNHSIGVRLFFTVENYFMAKFVIFGETETISEAIDSSRVRKARFMSETRAEAVMDVSKLQALKDPEPPAGN